MNNLPQDDEEQEYLLQQQEEVKVQESEFQFNRCGCRAHTLASTHVLYPA
jgi:hypothetical protein